MGIFRQMMVGAAASAALVSAAPAAAQVTIEGALTDISVHDVDPGLVITASPIAIPVFSLSSIGEFQDHAVMTIGTNETALNFEDDFAAYDISASFSFLSPTGATGSPVTGSTAGLFTLNFLSPCFWDGCGKVEWGAPSVFSFGDGGQFSVELFDATFGTPGTATVIGRFTLISNSVPEPATWAMLLIGFGTIGASLRARRARSAERRLRVA